MPHAYVSSEKFSSIVAPLLLHSTTKKPATTKTLEGLRALVNQAVWRIACRLLDGARILAGTHVVKPEDVYNLLRISLLMQMPLEDDPISRRLANNRISKASAWMNKGMQVGAGSTVFPSQYFSGSGGNGSTVMPAQYFSGSGGTTVLPAQYFGGQDHDELVTDAAMLAVLKEYRSRVTTPVRISEAARNVLRKHIEANVMAIVHECKGRPNALKGISSRWVTHVS
jgi:hypothetical protein